MVDVTTSGKIVDENHAESGDNDKKLSDTLIIIRHLFSLFTDRLHSTALLFSNYNLFERICGIIHGKILCESNFIQKCADDTRLTFSYKFYGKRKVVGLNQR